MEKVKIWLNSHKDQVLIASSAIIGASVGIIATLWVLDNLEEDNGPAELAETTETSEQQIF